MTNGDIYQSILSGFTASFNAMRLYPEKHPQTQSAIDRCFFAIENAFRAEAQVAMLVMDNTVFFNDHPLPGSGPSSEALVVLMKRKGVDRLVFRKGLTKEQLSAFLKNLSSKEDSVIYAQSHIQLGKIVVGPDGRSTSEADQSNGPAVKLPEQAARELRALYDGIHRNRLLSGADVNAFALDFVKAFNVAARPLGYLADIKSEDEYTYVHTINVALLTTGFAAYLGLSGKAQAEIACAALMHDVGKMFVPDKILNKQGSLDPEERAIMELHPVRGALYLSRTGGLPRLAIVVALEHHIKFDRTGYPRMGSEWKPHWISQMVSIADIFDALRSRRPYRDSLKQQEVFALLRKEIGTGLNPELVNRFIAMVEQQQADSALI